MNRLNNIQNKRREIFNHHHSSSKDILSAQIVDKISSCSLTTVLATESIKNMVVRKLY